MLYHMAINLLGTLVIPRVLELVNYEAMLSKNFVISAENIFSVLGFIWCEIIILGVSAFGIFLIVKKRNDFRPQSGLLPPPEGRGASCVMLSPGIAAAVALFAFTLFGSII